MYKPADRLVFNRTVADANDVAQLKSKVFKQGLQALTKEEQSLWLSSMLGSLNYSTLNRVEAWLEFVTKFARSHGYSLPDYKSKNWTIGERVYQTDIDRIRRGVNNLHTELFDIPEWRNITFEPTMSIDQQNALEWDLHYCYEWALKMCQIFRKSGQPFGVSGLNFLYKQHFDPPVVNPYNPVFGSNTWAQIIDACQKNAVPITWLDGDYKTLSVNNQECRVRIAGKNHDTYADDGKIAPITFEVVDNINYGVIKNGNGQNNSTGWSNSIIRKTVVPWFINAVPQEIKNAFRAVTKETSTGGMYFTKVEQTSDAVWIMAEYERFGQHKYSSPLEANKLKQYSVYAVDTEVTDGILKYWLRSPKNKDNTRFCAVLNATQVDPPASAEAFGIRPCFCF